MVGGNLKESYPYPNGGTQDFSISKVDVTATNINQMFFWNKIPSKPSGLYTLTNITHFLIK